MLVFATYTTNQQTYDNVAGRWIPALPPTEVISAQVSDEPSVAHGYNAVLDAFANQPNLEAIVLCRQELILLDADIVAKIRKVLIDDNVAVAGVAGGANVTSLAWWEAETHGNLRDAAQHTDYGTFPHPVEIIDGSFVVISRWAAQNIRFDDSYGAGFDGIVEDFCMQVRDANRSVIVMDLEMATNDVLRCDAIEPYRHAQARFAHKWSSRLSQHQPQQLATFLEIGGGTNAAQGWLNIDTEHAEGSFLRPAQETPWPVPDNHLRLIWASHVMEHIPAGRDRIATMNEAWRVLRPGGLLEIRLPSFPHWSAVADPTHVSFWVPESLLYFTKQLGANADYGIQTWESVSIEVNDGWELRGVLRKPVS